MMKALILLLMTMTLNAFSATADEQGHVLTQLWDKYEKAAADDRPKDQLKALEAIKAEAARQHLTLDFCDAARGYVEVRSSMNWKLRDSLETRLEKELEAFGEPVAPIYAARKYRNSDSLEVYIREHQDELRNSASHALYARDGRISGDDFGKILPRLIADDLEYALWCLNSDYWLSDGARQLIAEGLSRRYPMNALYELGRIDDGGKDEQSLRDFVQKYSGRAAALLAEQELLELRFSGLGERGADSDGYLRLLADCEALEDRAGKFGGDEKLIADICAEWCGALEEQLKSKDIQASSSGDTLTITLRNLASVHVGIFRDDEKISESRLDNPARSFYAADTLSMRLPKLADGRYSIKLSSDKTERSIVHEKYSISLAMKRDSEGPAIYAADYLSGKPLGWCSLTLRDEDGNIAAELPRLDIDGFSRLPGDFAAKFPETKWGWTVQASLSLPGQDTRLSRPLNISGYGFTADRASSAAERSDDALRCMLLTDRSAFNPGETVNFKAILYRGDYSCRLAEAGMKLTARLMDPEDKELSSLELSTGEFSSAAGSFVLRKSRLGGMYTIVIEHEGRTLASAHVLADEFVLPSFDLSWDEDGRFHLPGDKVEVRGNIKAYSGHSLSAADISYTVSDGETTLASGPLATDADGDFCISFNSSSERRYSHYAVSVKAVDATGETREFDRSLVIWPELPLKTELKNAATGSFELSGDDDRIYYRRSPRYLISESGAVFELGTSEGYSRPDAKISYSLSADGKVLKEGSMQPGELRLELEGSSSGIYEFKMEVSALSDSGEEFSGRDSVTILHVPAGSRALAASGIRSLFLEDEGEGLTLRTGATCGPVWAVAELYGDGDRLLDRKMVYLGGQAGREGNLETVEFKRRPEYPELLSLRIFYFRDGRSFSYTREFDFSDEEELLPLGFTRFLDTTAPSKAYSFIIKTEPGVECAASIFDASTETLMRNVWSRVRPWREPQGQIYFSSICGVNGSSSYGYMLRTKGTARMNTVMSAAPQAALDLAVTEEAEAAYGDVAGQPETHIRTDFENTVAWEPFLRSDENGEIRFDFNTSDKLSLYYVQLFAHDKNFRNNTLRREMTVTLPVKIAVVQPRYLYESDSWNAGVSVSNMLDRPVDGRISISFLDGSEPGKSAVLVSGSDSLRVEAGGAASFSLAVDAPAADTLGMLISFVPDNADYASDAVFVSIPVKKAVQTVTEAHSALYRPGSDRDALVESLRKLFVNADGSAAEVKEISIREMLEEAVPEELWPEDQDVLSLSAALWADRLLSSLEGMEADALSEGQKDSLSSKIAACANPNGGFGWFAGMNSSPVITAVLLERFSEMGSGCPAELSALLPAAVRYLDREMSENSLRPLWCGGLSLEQYLHVRALYPSVGLDFGGMERKQLKEFKKEVREYLAPAGNSGLNARIFAKARRLSTLQALLSGDEGVRLAKQLGIPAMTARRLSRTLERDIESLTQYAEAHASGGVYYPNAVMPWRGLLESELYAHALLCKLMDSCGQTEIAEGIRLWIMVQKETQKWESDPGYLDALAEVMRGSEQTLDTKVLALSASVRLPFGQIAASGNGFSVEREFYRDGKKLSEGDTLHVGDRLTAVYRVWSEENRSFVKLNVPRNAALMPVDQTSGRYGWMAKPLPVPGWTSFTPQGYRSVRADRTEYWFESYPEEKTSISEEFFVTQEGRFQSPAVEIESLYAPHYRANGPGGEGCMSVSNHH